MTRAELNQRFVDIVGEGHVYFQPPSSIKMKYPAIRYKFKLARSEFADDGRYSTDQVFEAILIDSNPDNTNKDKMLLIPYTSPERSYTSDNLNHYVFTIQI